VLVLLLAIVVEIVHLWVGRVELENALEAAALAAVKEWGDAGGGSTLIPRQIGAEYAAANTIFGVPVPIDLNYNPASGNVNENASCTGDLLFGAITNDARPWIFDAGVRPSCGGGTVLFDATGQGKAGLDADNGWGVAFIRTEDTPENLRIKTIIYDLRGGGGDGVYISSPVLSSNDPGQWKVRDGSGGNSQPDIEGFTNPAAQIHFSLVTPWQLRVDFTADGTRDAGFEPCDRFRFGIRVDGVGKGTTQNDGDGIGDDRVQVTVIFESGPVGSAIELPAVSVNFSDTMHKGCRANALTYPFCHTPPLHTALIVADADPDSLNPVPFLGDIPNLPCPASDSRTNNGQSWVLLQGGTGRVFAVRAQASATVPGLICRFCGIDFGPFQVHVETTARYDCETRRPELVRVRCENVICDIPPPP